MEIFGEGLEVVKLVNIDEAEILILFGDINDEVDVGRRFRLKIIRFDFDLYNKFRCVVIKLLVR